MRNDMNRSSQSRRSERSGSLFRAFSSYLRSASASSVVSTVRSAGASVASSILPSDDDDRHREQVQWAGFDKLELGRGIIRHVLLLAYTNGFQVWDIEDADDVHEIVSKRDAPVAFLKIQPRPITLDTEDNKFKDVFPLLLVVTSDAIVTEGGYAKSGGSLPQSGGSSFVPTVVRFYSLRSHTYVDELRFRSAIYSVRCSPRIIAVALETQICCFDAATLGNSFSVLTYPIPQGAQGPGCVNIGYGPMDVGPRWLAYAANHALVSNNGRASPQSISLSSSPLNGNLVAHYAKESSKQIAAGIVTLGDMGYKTLTKYCSELLTEGGSSPGSGSPHWKNNTNALVGHAYEPEHAGMVIVKDYVSKAVIAQFKAHKSPISALCFDPSGTLLVTASVHGHNLNVFRIMPSPLGNSSSSTIFNVNASHVHLYKLHRGLTNAVIQDISFSDDSRCIAISSSRGTSHLFAISPFGGVVGRRTHEGALMNVSMGSSLAQGSTRYWWSSSRLLKYDPQFPPPPPITLCDVHKIKNGNDGWCSTISGAAAAAAGRSNISSGAVATVFHNGRGQNLQSQLGYSDIRNHLWVFCPSGHVIRYALSLFYVAVLLLMSSSALGRFVVEKNSINVITPESLTGKRQSAIGNFGVPDYGGSMIGKVVYPEKGRNGCKSFEELAVVFNKSESPSYPLFVLTDRGECYFALKVWNAQNAGAAAVLVADDRDEPLITMDSPEQDKAAAAYLDRISIPSALIEKSFGDDLKKALEKGELITIKLDWTESMPHPDDRVEYEFWTNSNDECGPKCDDQMDFVREFKGHAQILERGGYTLFTPHYITWYCPEAFSLTRQCKSQCINHGRYCAPDPDRDLSEGYEGKDVVKENLRQLCVHRVANESGKPWVWWDYVTDFHIRCPMKENRYGKECAENIIRSLGLSVDEVGKCMGDPEADVDNPVLKAQQDAQVGDGSRGDVTILPTLVINNVQYRGKLDRTAVLKALCAGFKETTEPRLCLSEDIETNECLTNYGGCWNKANISACRDTFRGRVCECPFVSGVAFQGDGYLKCEAYGPDRCRLENGFCWSETRNGETYSACTDYRPTGCECPPGFRGDGQNCEDIDECKERTACQCSDCTCKNKWGGYDCKCKGDLLYIAAHDTCIARISSRFGWVLAILVIACLAGFATIGYVFYKYRLRSYMDSEIMAIMSQYMPLDQNEAHQPLQQSSA